MYPCAIMKVSISLLKRRSTSEMDCFLAPVRAGYVRFVLGSYNASIKRLKFMEGGPPSLVD